jgi:hypothetical protein
VNLGLKYSRLNTHLTPFFSNRQNISSEAGRRGNLFGDNAAARSGL